MKNNIKRLCMLLPLAAALLLPTGCKKDQTTFRVLAVAEQHAPDSDASKTQLVNETHVYWENDDVIDVCFLDNNVRSTATFSIEGRNDTTAIFDLNKEVKIPNDYKGSYLALFPANTNNKLETDNVVITFPNNQSYRNDNSFARAACPMVAYKEVKDGMSGENPLVRMLFHNLVGLVRIQLIDNVEDDEDTSVAPRHRLKSLTFRSKNGKSLSGTFNVTGYKENAPGLTVKSGNDYVTITPPDTLIPLLPVNNNNSTSNRMPLTFYLALPALSGTANTEYKIEMTAEAIDVVKKATVKMKKTFNVTIRRNGITKMPALTVTQWDATGDGTNSDVTPGITGNGTYERPFLIYTYEDLKQLRDACNTNTKINGTAITNGEYVRIMRGDIVLDETWTEGIKNFRGTMTYGASHASAAQGIKNNTHVPLFKSIGAKGSVDGITITGGYSWGVSSFESPTFSPLCDTNRGTISNCMVGSDYEFAYKYDNTSNTVGMGGICAENYKDIVACGCRGHLMAPKVGGICLNNHKGGKIERCFIPSPMRANVGADKSDSVGGICYNNEGTVKDCFFAANINNALKQQISWGGIVFQNSGKVEHCYVDASGILHSENSVGGIVHTLTGGTVENCWNDADLLQVDTRGGLGGLVFRMTGGIVRNCYRRRDTGSMTAKGTGVMGGAVARMSGGTVENSYVYSDMSQTVCDIKGMFVGAFTGGIIKNCYGEQSAIAGSMPFYGSKSSSAIIDKCYSKAAQAGITVFTDYTGDVSLLTFLNGYSDSLPTGWLSWVAGPTGEPPLHASSKRR